MRNLALVKERYEFNKLTICELIQEAKELRKEWEDNTMVYYRFSKGGGQKLTIYNGVGREIVRDVDYKDFALETMQPVQTHRQFVFASHDYNQTMIFYERRIAGYYRMRLFKKDMPNKTREFIETLLKY